MLSREERAEIERMAIRLDALASEVESGVEDACADSERFAESERAERWQSFADALREAASALELAEPPDED
jgi:hypothetical protein